MTYRLWLSTQALRVVFFQNNFQLPEQLVNFWTFYVFYGCGYQMLTFMVPFTLFSDARLITFDIGKGKENQWANLPGLIQRGRSQANILLGIQGLTFLSGLPPSFIVQSSSTETIQLVPKCEQPWWMQQELGTHIPVLEIMEARKAKHSRQTSKSWLTH